MDLTALFLELAATTIFLVTKPFSLVTLSCIFGVRSFCIVIHTWLELLRAAIIFHAIILWKLMIWTFALISLPVRVLTALQRERLLQMHLHELQIELENLAWNRKELQDRLQMAIKECRMMEAMLEEVEDEHDEAIVKIEILESELQFIKEENLRLKEIQGKGSWSFQSRDDTGSGNGHNNDVDGKYKDAWEDESKSKTELLDLMRTGLKGTGTGNSVTPSVIARYSSGNAILGQQWEVAVLQSLFSAVLSLLVGMIIWEAEDPCTPLVVALFTVVGMSLKSVVQFFSTIKNKPASNAVALLSFNCFILGTLTYPTLQRTAHVLTPVTLSFLKQTVTWFGFTS